MNPNFGTLAQAYGVEYASVETPQELEEAIRKMMEHEGPFFLEAKMTQQENVFPMIPAGKTLNDIIFE